MALTVEQLVARSELGTRVIAGAAGLPRPIGWAHACEMPDPWRWIGDGDLLMTTGLGVPAPAKQQVAYVERLAAVGAAGVAIGEDMEAPPLHLAMLDAAERCELPLMLTRYEIPFISLARAVIESNNEVHLERIRQTERVYEVLRRSSTEDLDLVGLLAELEEVVGCELAVLDAATARGLAHDERLPVDVAQAVLDWAPGEQDEAPVSLVVPEGAAAGVVVPSPRPEVLVAWSADGPLPESTVLRHMAAATALHQTRLFAERERALRLGATLLSALLDSRIGAGAARTQLAAAGLGDDDLVLAACSPAADGPDLHLLHHELGDAGVSHLMLHRPPLTYVLLLDDDEAVTTLADVLPDGAVAGVSDPVSSPGELPTAQRQARWALRRALARRLPLLHHSNDLGDSVFLPGDRDDSLAAAHRVLGEVMAYDAAHDAQLLDSLRVFLQENRSWQRAAARLHVHKQTLVYRMRKVEALTSRSLSSTPDVAELWLALQSATASGLIEH
jgi:purine catabolism regulator